MRGARLVVAQHKAERVFRKYEGFSPRNEKQPGWHLRSRWTRDELQRVVGIYRKTKVSCSCEGCGNVRRNWGYLPLREVRQHQDADSQYEEIYWSYRKLRWLVGWLD